MCHRVTTKVPTIFVMYTAWMINNNILLILRHHPQLYEDVKRANTKSQNTKDI
jgi:hypothetical protein